MALLDRPAAYVVEPEPAPPRSLLARIVPIVAVFGLLGLTGTAGTWASFTASTDNAASLHTGALVLANTVTGGPTGTCYSDQDNGVTVNASQCDQFFAVTNQKPGTTASQTLTLENVGSMDAATLRVFAPSACASVDTAGSYHGTADLCTKLALTIQEYSDAGFTTASACVYGGGAGATCSFDATKTVAAFVTAHGDVAAGTVVGDLQKGAAHRRYFKISTQLPDAPDNNTVQGRKATFALTWQIEQ